MEARLVPLSTPRAAAQLRAFDEACAELVPRMLDGVDCEAVRDETLALSGAALERFRAAPPSSDSPEGDAHDDDLLGDDEAAAIILGLQDRGTRDIAAAWMEGSEAPYADHAAAPLTLAGWVSWSNGDEPAARVAFGRALHVDPQYTFAKLLHQACNHGLDPEPLRICLREERGKRLAGGVGAGRPAGAGTGPKGRHDRSGPSVSSTRPGAGSHARTRIRPRRHTQTAGDDPAC
jgi:hypothetical protein